jgi:general stress protein YciG
MANNKQNRGFAAMDEDKQRDIARKGGASVPAESRSFSRDPGLAAEAGRKGGQNVAPEDRSFSRDPGLAAQAGRIGGQNSHGGRAASATDDDWNEGADGGQGFAGMSEEQRREAARKGGQHSHGHR